MKDIKKIDEAGAIAAGLCQHLDASEQAMFIAGFQECVKWQVERMYSDIDIKQTFFSAIKITGEGFNGEYASGNNPNVEEEFKEVFDEWFNEFKNK